MLKAEEPREGAPKSGRGSTKYGGVNEVLVENFIGLLAAFSDREREVILAEANRLYGKPDCPTHNSSASCAPDKKDSSPTPDKEHSPTPSLAGWVSTLQAPPKPTVATIVDLCKRIEFCYQEFQRETRKLPKLPYIDFQATKNLVESIIADWGFQALVAYVEHLEALFQNRESPWYGFDRPERMRQHWEAYIQKKKSQPPSQ